MVTFTASTRIAQLNIGERLRNRRQEFGLDLEDIAQATSISKRNLEHLEENLFEKIPEGFYRELFLKNYSTYLGLPWRNLEEDYKKQTRLYHPTIEDEEVVSPKMTIQSSQLLCAPRIVRNSMVAASLAAVFVYLSFLAYTIVRPPQITILSPIDNSATAQGKIVLSGMTPDDARVQINGQDVTKDQEGIFKQDVVLTEGINTIRVTASKKYSRSAEITRRIFYRKDTAKAEIHANKENKF